MSREVAFPEKFEPNDTPAVERARLSLGIDGAQWQLGFRGFNQPLQAYSYNGKSAYFELKPWRWREHFEALRASLRIDGGQLDLDAAEFTDRVLRGVGQEVLETIGDRASRALALWWASGQQPEVQTAAAPLHPVSNNRVQLSETQWASVHGWTWGERIAAESRFLQSATGKDTFAFDVIGYLEAMMHSCIREICDEAPQKPSLASLEAQLAELSASATRRLLAAVLSQNDFDAADDPLNDASSEQCSATLRICSSLGWSPHQVLTTSAAEIERLLRLLDRVSPQALGQQGAASSDSMLPSTRPSIAEYPDAVVLRFENNPSVNDE